MVSSVCFFPRSAISARERWEGTCCEQGCPCLLAALSKGTHPPRSSSAPLTALEGWGCMRLFGEEFGEVGQATGFPFV